MNNFHDDYSAYLLLNPFSYKVGLKTLQGGYQLNVNFYRKYAVITQINIPKERLSRIFPQATTWL